jgi:hypothetical protein
MDVVALSGLVVETYDADAIDDEHEPVFVVVPGAANRSRHPPDCHFREGSLVDIRAVADDLDSLHVGDNANTRQLLSNVTTPFHACAGVRA